MLVAAGHIVQFAMGCREMLVTLVHAVDALQILCMSLILGFSNTASKQTCKSLGKNLLTISVRSLQSQASSVFP